MVSQSDGIRVSVLLLMCSLCTIMYAVYYVGLLGSTRVGCNIKNSSPQVNTTGARNISANGATNISANSGISRKQSILHSNKNILKSLADVAKIPPAVMSPSLSLIHI